MPSLHNLTPEDLFALNLTTSSNVDFTTIKLTRSSVSSTSHALSNLYIDTNSIYEVTLFVSDFNGKLAYIKAIASRLTGAPVITNISKVSNFNTATLGPTTGNNTLLTLTLSDSAYIAYIFVTII